MEIVHNNAIQVSVVIPLYNKGRTICRTLDSILNQSFKKWECVVIDDGSTDAGPSIVRSITDTRIRLYSQKNSGPGAARNHGVKLSRAGLLAFLDADDEWHPDYLLHHIEQLARYPEATASICGHTRVGTHTDTERLFRQSGIEDGLWQMPQDYLPEQIKIATDFMHSGSVMIRKETFLKYGGYFDRFRSTYCEDTHLWLQVVASERLYRSPKPLMSYHVEDSVLGLGRKSSPPPWPMLYNPDVLLAACRPETRQTLRSGLSFYALLACNRLLIQGRCGEALKVLRVNDGYRILSSPRAMAERKKMRLLLLKQPYYLLKRAILLGR